MGSNFLLGDARSHRGRGALMCEAPEPIFVPFF